MAKATRKAKKYCPTCGCEIIEGFYDQKGIEYCCEACATGGECGCGCCEIKTEKK